ncbi:unnamed protein product [Enterobius vermicularis]|uniref:CYSTM domain-containing protein n=1 Tax=Enterobius vermicularis TaxID=51028 RepID=A0A0N4V904_ENTVE|nr:unnamed protein product [Enterobius vermicularis]
MPRCSHSVQENLPYNPYFISNENYQQGPPVTVQQPAANVPPPYYQYPPANYGQQMQPPYFQQPYVHPVHAVKTRNNGWYSQTNGRQIDGGQVAAGACAGICATLLCCCLLNSDH